MHGSSPTVRPGIERWNRRFGADPIQAIGDLLAGRLFLGAFARARPSEALVQLLAPEQIPVADQALQDWLAQVLGAPAQDKLPGKRFADALVEAFRAMQMVPLPQSRAWCASHHGPLRTWLRGFYFGRSRDPLATMLIALQWRSTARPGSGLDMAI